MGKASRRVCGMRDFSITKFPDLWCGIRGVFRGLVLAARCAVSWSLVPALVWSLPYGCSRQNGVLGMFT